VDDRKFGSLARSLESGSSRRTMLKRFLGGRGQFDAKGGGGAPARANAESGHLSRRASLEWNQLHVCERHRLRSRLLCGRFGLL
jgi:hypothetical protein